MSPQHHHLCFSSTLGHFSAKMRVELHPLRMNIHEHFDVYPDLSKVLTGSGKEVDGLAFL